MEYSDCSKSVVRTTSVVHPLVVSSACDHYTRVALGGSKLPATAPVYGLIFGNTTITTEPQGETLITINICDSTDAIYEYEEGKGEAKMLIEYINKKIQLWTAVFTEYRLVGWYTFGKEASPEHMRIQKVLEGFTLQYKISPIFILMYTEMFSDQLPLQVLQVEDILVDSSKSSVFVTVPFKLDATPVEQISIDQIIKSVPTAAGFSAQELRNLSITTSLSILHNKTSVLIEAVKKMERGEVPLNQDVVRSAAKIVNLLTVATQTQNEDDVDGLSGEKMAMVVSYLSAATKTVFSLSEMADVYTLVYGDDLHA